MNTLYRKLDEKKDIMKLTMYVNENAPKETIPFPGGCPPTPLCCLGSGHGPC